MLPSPPDSLPRTRAERMILTQVITAVALALLVLVGVWTSVHSPANAHGTESVSVGVSQSDSVAPAVGDVAVAGLSDALVSDAPASDVSGGLLTSICCFALGCLVLVLAFRRIRGPLSPPLRSREPQIAAPHLTRSGAQVATPLLTLTQLSISRT